MKSHKVEHRRKVDKTTQRHGFQFRFLFVFLSFYVFFVSFRF